MAPAPQAAARDSDVFNAEAVSEADRDLLPCLRRRALASVDNVALHMEEDDMGLQSHHNLVKDSQEMEQILNDLGSTEIGQADLLQAIKTLEGSADNLSTEEADPIFPLSGFDLAEPVEPEPTTEDKIRMMQERLEQRCSFLQRRLRILQARAIGKRISEEAAQSYEKCLKGSRKDGSGRTPGIKALLKRIETTGNLQASAASRSVQGPKYYRAGSSRSDLTRASSIGIPSGTLAGLEDTAGALHSHLTVIKHELDSDATLSSSGVESNDEEEVYNNPVQQHMPIDKRALWSWQRARASISSRWIWLQAQIQELDYKIRQHADLKKQVRLAKGPVEFEGDPEPAGYEGPLPGLDELSDDDPSLETCARIRPLIRESFKKRKLLQMHNLHTATVKAARPADIRCGCQYPVEGCAVCTGRAVSTEPLPPLSTLSAPQRIALVDPYYHPVLSDIRDVSPSIHLSALASCAWFRSRWSQRSWRGSHHSAAPKHQPQPQTQPQPQSSRPHKKPTRTGKRGRPPLSRRIKERERDREEETVMPVVESRARPRASTESRHTRLNSSYDIDNIVIPQSVAANTRPEILHYKEILTPKWRVMELQEPPLNNGVAKYYHDMSDSDDEDVTDGAVRRRHTRAEASERGKYIRKQKTRRSVHQVEGELPPPPPPPPPPQPEYHETVRPYTPRQFPLTDEMYSNMLSMMPEGYRPISPSGSPTNDENEEVESSLSPMSPLVFEGDDPDDVEWAPSKEKGDRRKSQYR